MSEVVSNESVEEVIPEAETEGQITEAIEEIARCAGTHCDPALAKVIVSIDRRKLQAIVGLHVFSAPAMLPEHPVSSSEASLARIHPEFTRRTA